MNFLLFHHGNYNHEAQLRSSGWKREEQNFKIKREIRKIKNKRTVRTRGKRARAHDQLKIIPVIIISPRASIRLSPDVARKMTDAKGLPPTRGAAAAKNAPLAHQASPCVYRASWHNKQVRSSCVRVRVQKRKMKTKKRWRRSRGIWQWRRPADCHWLCSLITMITFFVFFFFVSFLFHCALLSTINSDYFSSACGCFSLLLLFTPRTRHPTRHFLLSVSVSLSLTRGCHEKLERAYGAESRN